VETKKYLLFSKYFLVTNLENLQYSIMNQSEMLSRFTDITSM